MNIMKAFLVFAFLGGIFSCSTPSNKSLNTKKDEDRVTPLRDSIAKTSTAIRTKNVKIDTIFFSLGYDLDADGNKDSVLVFKKEDSNYLQINTTTLINLYTAGLNTIATETGKYSNVVMLQNSKDNRFDIIVSLQDSVLEDESFVKVYRYKSSNLIQRKFYYSETSFFDYLIAKGNFLGVSIKGEKICCCTNTVATDNDSGISYKIDYYTLDSNRGEYILKESKIFDESIFKNPLQVFK